MKHLVCPLYFHLLLLLANPSFLLSILKHEWEEGPRSFGKYILFDLPSSVDFTKLKSTQNVVHPVIHSLVNKDKGAGLQLLSHTTRGSSRKHLLCINGLTFHAGQTSRRRWGSPHFTPPHAFCRSAADPSKMFGSARTITCAPNTPNISVGTRGFNALMCKTQRGTMEDTASDVNTNKVADQKA